MVTSHVAGDCRLEVVRLLCGDPSSKGPGMLEEHAPFDVPVSFTGREQPLRPGSCVVVDPSSELAALGSFGVRVLVWPTRPGNGVQSLVATFDQLTDAGFALFIDDTGVPTLRVGATVVSTGVALLPRRWVELTAGYDAVTGALRITQAPLATRSPADPVVQRPAAAAGSAPAGLRTGGRLLFGAWNEGDAFAAHLDGKLEQPTIAFDPAPGAKPDARWDFARGIGTTVVVDVGPLGLHGLTVQAPARAVAGSRWDGSVQRWIDAPEQYAAIHFHRDDLADAGWSADATVRVPEGLRSGIYAFKVTGPDGDVDRTPFFVRPPDGTATARLAFLVPTATYYAYANHRMTISGADFFPARNRLRPEFAYLRQHPEVGYSMYEYHDDQSGVMFSSRRRPILNLKPGADGWAFTADTNFVAFLEQAGIDVDVVTDDDLHHQGRALLDRYDTVMTGSHPEYWSTSMLDALEAWLGDGGRFMYMGGNGLYWRVAWSPDEPWIMEVRRAEDGTRGWIAEPGEYFHAYGGEYGGLWRRLGRAPNLLVGVGFAAQGFDRASYYRRTPASFEGRASWIFDGVESPEIIGDYGVGGGAAGQEIDRFDLALGSPPHAVVLATSEAHTEEMLRTKEELLATRMPGFDPKIRADVVFFETPKGGAVFSTGSIAWYGALAHRGPGGERYDNDIARITTNVLRRFLDPTPFPAPDAPDAPGTPD